MSSKTIVKVHANYQKWQIAVIITTTTHSHAFVIHAVLCRNRSEIQ